MLKFTGPYKLRNVCAHCGFVNTTTAPYDDRGQRRVTPNVCGSCGHKTGRNLDADWKVYSVRRVGFGWNVRYELSPVHRKMAEEEAT